MSYGTTTLRLKDSRGVRLLEILVANPGRDLHVLELVGAGPAVNGDADGLLDEQAIASYRRRVDELRGAGSSSDAARAEMEALTAELARAVGLGGRIRRAGDAAERARTAVQKRLRALVRRIATDDPEIGRHLDRSLRTGMFCRYEPE